MTPAASHATRFASAITRRPAASAVDGLRAQDMGAVDIKLMASQHSDYQAALRQAGAVVIELPALPEFPMLNLLKIPPFACLVWR